MSVPGTKLVGGAMILPDLLLPSKANQYRQFSGLDSPELCLNKTYFNNYPHKVDYRYNSRGFRDLEWPENLTDAIWCIGDSFTVGIGSSIDHTWPVVLSKTMGRRIINVSMDGASNNWISRKAVQILGTVNTSTIVLHWSYIHRRESSPSDAADKKWIEFYNNVKDPSWPDCPSIKLINTLLDSSIQRELKSHAGFAESLTIDDFDCAIWYLQSASEQEDINNLLDCINLVECNKGNNILVHSFIPGFCPSSVTQSIFKQLPFSNIIPPLDQVDYARDYHHYDIVTSTNLVNRVIDFIS